MVNDCKTIAEVVADMEVAPGKTMWAKRVGYLVPRHFVELGTGDGASGTDIMTALPETSRFTTIDCRKIYDGAFERWSNDKRLNVITGDTIDHNTLSKFIKDIDLLYIDTNHVAYHAATELRMWQEKLVDGAIVIVDDLNQNDMMVFWNSITYDKQRCMMYQGVFRYDGSRPYTTHFPKPSNMESYSAW